MGEALAAGSKRLSRLQQGGLRGSIFYWPVFVWFGLLVLAPGAYLLSYSLWRSENGATVTDWGLQNYTRLLESDVYRTLLLRTVLTALLAVAIALCIAYPLAYFVAFCMRRGRLLALMLVILPLWVSFLIRVFAWKIILGDRGALNSMLRELGLTDEPVRALLYTRTSVVIVLTYVAIPFIFVAAYTALERVPSYLLEAADDCGSPRRRVFTDVVWPLTRTGTAVGCLVAFLVCVGDYLTPTLVGGISGTMLGSLIAAQFGTVGNWALGAAAAILLLAATAAVILLLAPLSRGRGILLEEGRRAHLWPAYPTHRRGRVRAVGRWALVAVPYAFLYAPLAMIAVFSFNDSTIQTFPLSGFTTHWYSTALSTAPLVDALQTSLTVALLVVPLSAAIGTGFALCFRYTARRGTNLMASLISVPVLLPGTVLGLALALTFQQFGLPFGLPTIALGHLTYSVPIVALVVLGRLRRLDPSLVEAAMDCGAGRCRTFATVLFPQIRSALFGACLLVFTLSFDEIVMTFFLAGPEQTLPVYVWTQLRFGFTPAINAILTLILLGSATAVAFASWALRRDIGTLAGSGGLQVGAETRPA